MPVEIIVRPTLGSYTARAKGHKVTASRSEGALQAAEALLRKLDFVGGELLEQASIDLPQGQKHFRFTPTNELPSIIDYFYVQDSRSTVGSRATFWRTGGGYTTNLKEAEQFLRDRAIKLYETRSTDIPWPVNYVQDHSEIGVDCQYLDSAVAAASPNRDGRIFVAYDREWDGNDLIWVGGDGPTSDLMDAIHPQQGSTSAYLKQGFQVWPVSYITQKCRPVVRADKLDRKESLPVIGLCPE